MICFSEYPSIVEAWENLRRFLESAFISAFLSSLAGAGFGVWGAQRLASRSASRKELLDALRQANALIVLSATIANQVLAVKKQHIAPLSHKYFSDRAAAHAVQETLRQGGKPQVFHFEAQMVKITPLTLPVDALKNLTYSAELMPGRALALVSMVEQSVTELAHAVDMRSEQIEYFKSQNMPVGLFAQNYFGLKREDGNTDGMYHDSMLAVTQYTNDVAFFSSELADELQAHAARIRQQLLKFTNEAPKANTVDFSGPRASGLMPSREYYEDWLSGFKSQE